MKGSVVIKLEKREFAVSRKKQDKEEDPFKVRSGPLPNIFRSMHHLSLKRALCLSGQVGSQLCRLGRLQASRRPKNDGVGAGVKGRQSLLSPLLPWLSSSSRGEKRKPDLLDISVGGLCWKRRKYTNGIKRNPIR